jgi:pimeloyl-ACP methyl ester carboxylesterase
MLNSSQYCQTLLSAEAERLEVRDLVVVLPGILGSTLVRDGQQVWAPSSGAVWRAIRSFGASIQSLTLPVDLGDDHPGDGVEPLALMPDLHLLPGIWSANIGYDRLLGWLTQRFKLVLADPQNGATSSNLLQFAYDWRLSCRYNACRLKRVVEPALERWRALDEANREARLIFICHSMGGLVARWYVEQEGGAAHTRKLITIGTPHRGAVAALQQLVNGVEKSVGPLRLDLSRFARSLPSVHQLLPQYACLQTGTGLTPISAVALPNVNPAQVADALAFHAALDAAPEGDAAAASAYALHPIVGTRQPTPTTARLVGERLETSDAIEGAREGGDGTVPRLAAAPKALSPDDPRLRYAPDQHLGLHSHQAVLDELEGVLTARPVIHRGLAGPEIGVRTEPLLLLGEPLVVWAEVAAREPLGLMAELLDESGRLLERRKLRVQDSGQGQGQGHGQSCVFQPPGAGAWQVRVVAAGGSAGAVTRPVSAISLVCPQEQGP